MVNECHLQLKLMLLLIATVEVNLSIGMKMELSIVTFKCSKDLTRVSYHLRMISSLIMNHHHACSLQDA
jgi:hypothetical protein